MPLNVVWGDEVLKDGVDIDPPAFYERLQVAEIMPTTSQPSAGEFMDFFRQVAEEKKAHVVLGIFISSKLSGTIASAQAARGMLPDLHVEVVDSLSTSMGQGFQVMAAAEVVQSGGSLEDALKAARRVRSRLQILFVVDTLEFLHRGGRIGGAKRFLGTALRIKPLLELEGGEIEPLEQVRTKKKALARALEVGRERSAGGNVPQAAVVHANRLEDCVELKERVEDVLRPEEMYLTELSPVIGTHVGPGTLGFAFYSE
jgi:DegV family protein with EDD domain